MKFIWTPGSNLAFPDIVSRNETLEGYQKHQLQHKKIPQDIEFFAENGNPVCYKIQHEDNPKDTCNDFYPIHRQQGSDEKVLRLYNDGESDTLNSISKDFPNLSVQSAADCFRMSKTINQFSRLCYPLFYSPILHENSDPTYSSISSLDSEEADSETINVVTVPPYKTEGNEEEDEDDHFSRIDTNIDHYRLFKAKTAHDSILSKVDASLAKKPLTITEAPHMDTKKLIL